MVFTVNAEVIDQHSSINKTVGEISLGSFPGNYWQVTLVEPPSRHNWHRENGFDFGGELRGHEANFLLSQNTVIAFHMPKGSTLWQHGELRA